MALDSDRHSAIRNTQMAEIEIPNGVANQDDAEEGGRRPAAGEVREE